MWRAPGAGPAGRSVAIRVEVGLADFLRGLRRPGGGFANRAGDQTGRLPHTVSVLKALRLQGMVPDDPDAIRGFVRSCFDERSGGFAAWPGAEPTVADCALGLIASHALGDSPGAGAQAERATRFMRDRARTALDHFMTIAAHEEGAATAPTPVAALDAFRRGRSADGTYGPGVRDNAIAVSALLRAGDPVADTGSVVRLLRDAQWPEGGFAEPGRRPDLMTTYAVMRALDLLRAPPDLCALITYIRALWRGSGYGETPHADPTADATYQALSVLGWVDRLSPLRAGTREAVAAARCGDVAALQRWLEGGGDPEIRDDDGWTPLLAAAARGRAECVRLLLFHDVAGARRADPGGRFVGAGALPIYLAGQSGDLETTLLLLRACPQHLFDRARVNGHTVLLQAAFFGKPKHVALARHLLEHVGEILGLAADADDTRANARRRLLVATNVRGYTALRMNTELWNNQRMASVLAPYDQATREEQQQYVQALLAEVAPPEATQDESQSLTDALIAGIEAGYAVVGAIPADAHAAARAASDVVVGIVRALVETPGLQIDRLGGRLQQPAIVVAVTGVDANPHASALRRRVAELLLEHGADPDRPERHPMAVDAVIRAAVLGHFGLLTLLATRMSPEAFAVAMNTRPAVNGLTALHDSVHRALTAPPDRLPERIDQIRWMVAHGARCDLEDHTGETQADLARRGLRDGGFERANALAVLDALGLAADR